MLSYKGDFIPTFIPDGYSVKSMINEADKNEIVFSNADMCMLIFKEQSNEIKTNIDYSDANNLQEIEILGYKGIAFEKDGSNRVVITTENAVLYITCDDDTVDLIGVAKKIEKR